MIFITVTCDNCKWAKAGDTRQTGEDNFDAILRQALAHAERERHTIGLIGTLRPDERERA